MQFVFMKPYCYQDGPNYHGKDGPFVPLDEITIESKYRKANSFEQYCALIWAKYITKQIQFVLPFSAEKINGWLSKIKQNTTD